MAIDPSLIFTALSNLASTGASIASASDAKERNAQLIEFQYVIIQLQSSIASIQAQNATLLQTKDALEKQIMGMENWEAEKQKHELKEIARGVFARIDKSYVGSLQSAHKFCATCFEKNIKSPLQQQNADMRQISVNCFSCKSHIVFRHYSDVS